MTRERILYLIISAITVTSAWLLTRYYRPYAYSNNVQDFGFADVIGSLASVIGFCFLVWGINEYSDRQKNTHIIMMTITYGIVWEIFGLFGIHGTFDWKDIIAATFSGIFTYYIKEVIKKRKSSINGE